ncbi:MAG: hypothetical protein Q9159_001880 [Coniocarpon cinnabarinum]
MSLQGSSNRRQPTRSVRTSANRPSNYYAKPFSYRNTAAAPVDNEPSIPAAPGFFPAISFFTDAIAALPKEMQKHFTLLKETEGKLHQPDQAVNELVKSINELPDPPTSTVGLSQAYMQLPLAASMSGSAAASVANGMTPRPPQTFAEADTLSAEQLQSQDPHLAQREDLFRQLTLRLNEMTSALDEKNMILTAANETLSRQLSRLDSAMPHIEKEISEDARLGSNTHWALPHMKEMRRVNGTGTTDRGRRELNNVNNLAAAAAVVHEGEIAATRSEARREAIVAKRTRARDLDSDLDDRTISKKHIASKVRKAADAASEGKTGANAQAQKRRKLEKPAAVERSMAAALGGRIAGSRASPRGSPAPDTNRKKAKAAPGTSTARRKPAANPSSLASSPTRGTFPTTSNRAPSPSRPQASKPQHTPLQNLAQENARGRRPSSASSVRKNGSGDEPSTANKPAREESTTGQPAFRGPSTNEQSPASGVRQPVNSNAKKRRESIVKSERPDTTDIKPQLPKNEDPPLAAIGRHSRAGSRTSKPNTPVNAVFPEPAPMIRSRSMRNGNQKESNGAQSPPAAPSSPNKRSHKKSGRVTASTNNNNNVNSSALPSRPSSPSEDLSDHGNAQRPRRTTKAPRGAHDGAVDDAGNDEDDENEERICHCNRVSFGDMVACDNERCKIEWFHVECVGLDKPPKENVKWFCSEKCKREARSLDGSR